MKNLLYDINRQILIDIFHFFLPYLRATHLFEVWQEDLSWCGRSQILSLSLSLWIPILSQRRTFLHVLSTPAPLLPLPLNLHLPVLSQSGRRMVIPQRAERWRWEAGAGGRVSAHAPIRNTENRAKKDKRGSKLAAGTNTYLAIGRKEEVHGGGRGGGGGRIVGTMLRAMMSFDESNTLQNGKKTKNQDVTKSLITMMELTTHFTG